ncbi:hypothetical protein NKR23_g12299 [Pleurostoma richardsiae]|uniref:Uncharacterized protein n=1 Tax=Pleurostoma richardsiae TaxID=41990 RepID=A0AA38VG72_9PEZI|nr:hypothetical protein NKR23_g12299 [Pleurostoma richardsiae]
MISGLGRESMCGSMVLNTDSRIPRLSISISTEPAALGRNCWALRSIDGAISGRVMHEGYEVVIGTVRDIVGGIGF